MNFRRFIRAYFDFTTREKNSLVALLCLLTASFFIPSIFIPEIKHHWKIDSTKTKHLDSLVDKLQLKTEKNNDKHQFIFDPNTVSKTNFILLGFSSRQADNLINYRNKGGKFKTEKDLMKLYTINAHKYDKIKHLVNISKTKKIIFKKTVKQKYNINNLDIIQCENLGLSVNIANRIVKYLKTGAYFKKVSDIKKIYGLNQHTYEQINKQLFVDADNNVPKHKYELFDPNTCSYEKLINLGFSAEISKRIKKYTSKGYRFNESSDLKKIYGLDSSLYLDIYKYIKIKNIVKQNININNINENEFIKTKLVRAKLASRIIKYRKILGGFNNKKQFNEVYGISKEEIINMHKNTFIDTSLIRKIIIDKTTNIKSLIKHPYLNYTNSKLMMNFINNTQLFKSRKKNINNNFDIDNNISISNIKQLIYELGKQNILPDSVYYKIKPYVL